MTISKLIILILLMSVSIMANAKLYQWTDANGKFHVSDRPPLDPQKVELKNKKKKKKKVDRKKANKEVIAWRCKELEEQYENALNKAMRYATDKSLAASMKSDAENYKKALDKICS